MCKNNFGLIKFLITLSIILISVAPAFSKVQTQFVPSVSITEEYTDNYNQTQNNKDDEFSTIYRAGFSFGLIGKNANMFLGYTPQYTDYNTYNENDAWRHEISLDAMMEMTEHTTLTFSESFVRDLNRSDRTNNFEEHDTNTTSAGLSYDFGERDTVGFNYEYSFDKYENPNADEFTTHNPSAFLSYWFTSQYGIQLNTAYEKTEFDVSTDEPKTISGDIRLLRSMTRHLDIYIAYAHTDTDRDSGDQTIYNPSAGFNWEPTEDSNISLGIGMLFQDWENQEDSETVFLELDAFKTFNFSRRGTLSITGSSGYTPTSTTAASLGYEIYYQAGALLSYRITRRLTGELNSTYEISQFEDPSVDRQDNTIGLGAGLIWSPLQWLSINLSYSFIDFNTDDNVREDYQENVVRLTVSMTPSRPVRFQGSSTPRSTLEDRLFE